MKFSIIITAYNYEKYINECVESCLGQLDVEEFEVIVVDDGSTDMTRRKLDAYNDSRLRIYSIENSGIEKASNFGFMKAKGEYVIRVDADDKLELNYLKVMSSYEAINDTRFFFSNYKIIDAASNTTESISLPSFDKIEILERGDFLATGTMIHKATLFEIGFYSERVRNSGLENYELIINFLKAGYNGELVENSLFCYRRHDYNLSELKRLKIIEYGHTLFKENEFGDFRTNLNHPYKLVI